MPKSDLTKSKRTVKASKNPTSTHFPSKPYMRAIHTQPHTNIPTAAWSTTDDELLLRSKSSGKKWVEISPLFKGKTSNACRKRYARLVTHTQVEWDEFKERDLAVEFVNAKVGFFKVIAGNMKLEWRQVEKKCFELGFKTLLEKGKRLPLPFPQFPSPELEQTQTEIDESARQDSPLLSDIKTGSSPTVPFHTELSGSDSDVPRAKNFKGQKRPTMARTKLDTTKCRESGENVVQDEADGDGDLGLEILMKGGCIDTRPEIE